MNETALWLKRGMNSYGKWFERIPHFLWASDVSLSNCFGKYNRTGAQPVSMRPPVLLRRSVGHPCPTVAILGVKQ